MKKQEAQLRALREKSVDMTKKLNATGESNRIITQAMRMKQEELDQLQIRYVLYIAGACCVCCCCCCCCCCFHSSA